MTYYILLDNVYNAMDTMDDIWDENILGEESFGRFYTGNGFKAFQNMVVREPQILETITIVDERKNSYSIEEFLDLISKWKIKS